MLQRRLLSSLRGTSLAAKNFQRVAPSIRLSSRLMSSDGDVAKEKAITMPREFEEMSSDTIIVLARMGDQEAREERLLREIMQVDDVDRQGAQPRFKEMMVANRNGMWLATFPYKVGLVTSVASSILAIPMVFDYNTILWFNEHYVTTDIPEPADLETWLECGAWAWNWMEPPLGTISFVLLALQFARSQLGNLKAQPYTEWMKNRRANRLYEAFPQYNHSIVKDFARGDNF